MAVDSYCIVFIAHDTEGYNIHDLSAYSGEVIVDGPSKWQVVSATKISSTETLNVVLKRVALDLQRDYMTYAKSKLHFTQNFSSTASEHSVKDKVARIRKLENELFLNMNVKSLTPPDTTLDGGVDCLFRLHLRLYRDEFDGPAHIAFCIDSTAAAEIDVQIQIDAANFEGIVNVSQPIASASVVDTSSDAELQFKFKVYGKLCENFETGDPHFPEGGFMRAMDLRYIFEPEYFPEILLSKPDAQYPAINFRLIERNLKDVVSTPAISVHSWNFEELQSKKLMQLMVNRRKLQEAKFKLNDLESRVNKAKGASPNGWSGQCQWILHVEDSMSDHQQNDSEKNSKPILFATLHKVDNAKQTDEMPRKFKIPVQFYAGSSLFNSKLFQQQSMYEFIDAAGTYVDSIEDFNKLKKNKEESVKKKQEESEEHQNIKQQLSKADRKVTESRSAYLEKLKDFIGLKQKFDIKNPTNLSRSLNQSTKSIEDLLFNQSNSLSSNFPDIYFAPLVAPLAVALRKLLPRDPSQHSQFCNMMSKFFDPNKNKWVYTLLTEFEQDFFKFFEQSLASAHSVEMPAADLFADESPASSAAPTQPTAAAESVSHCVAKFKYSNFWDDFAKKKLESENSAWIRNLLPNFAAALICAITGGSDITVQVVRIFPELCSSLEQSGVKWSEMTLDEWEAFEQVEKMQKYLQKQSAIRQDLNDQIERLTIEHEDLVKECLEFATKKEDSEDKETNDGCKYDLQTLETFKFFLQKDLIARVSLCFPCHCTAVRGYIFLLFFRFPKITWNGCLREAKSSSVPAHLQMH